MALQYGVRQRKWSEKYTPYNGDLCDAKQTKKFLKQNSEFCMQLILVFSSALVVIPLQGSTGAGCCLFSPMLCDNCRLIAVDCSKLAVLERDVAWFPPGSNNNYDVLCRFCSVSGCIESLVAWVVLLNSCCSKLLLNSSKLCWPNIFSNL